MKSRRLSDDSEFGGLRRDSIQTEQTMRGDVPRLRCCVVDELRAVVMVRAVPMTEECVARTIHKRAEHECGERGPTKTRLAGHRVTMLPETARLRRTVERLGRQVEGLAPREGRALFLLSQVEVADGPGPRSETHVRRRLRAAGVSFEDRQDLLGHRSGRMTTHYSAAELGRPIDAANRVCERDGFTPGVGVIEGHCGS